MRRLLFFLLLLAVSAILPAHAQSPHQSLRKGDGAYDKKEFKKAEDAYRQALTKSPKDPKALYNTGNTAYRQGNYADAVGLYTEAAQQAPDTDFKSDALYNLGNAHLQQRQYDKAVEAYQQSLRLRPGDANAKSNLQFAKKKLREQQEQEKQKQQQQEQEQQQNQEQNPPENQPQDQPQDEPQQEQPQQPSEQGQEPNQPQPKQQAPQPGKISPEQARQTLDNSIGPADQKSARRYRENQQPRDRPRAKKDW
ncbi:MAG: tetratricopeptide repeat protein [Saprospiraceae bacterium]|nr:tetratricopeptide repeat protein [Saprospiraceae bacterium]